MAEQTAQLAEVKTLRVRTLPEDAEIGVGALVTLEEDGRSNCYRIAPHGGGLLLEGGAVQVVTPTAPIWRAMLGKRDADIDGDVPGLKTSEAVSTNFAGARGFRRTRRISRRGRAASACGAPQLTPGTVLAGRGEEEQHQDAAP